MVGLVVSIQCTDVTDRQTDTERQQRPRYAQLREVKTVTKPTDTSDALPAVSLQIKKKQFNNAWNN